MVISKFVPMAVMVSSSLLICGCSDKREEYHAPEFKKEVHLDFEILGDEWIGSPSNIVATDKYILVSGYAGPGEDTFYVYDKDGNLIRSGIRHGNGPAETITGYINMSCYGDLIQYTDLQKGERLSFSLGDFLGDGVLHAEKEYLGLPGWCTYAMQTPDKGELRVISRSATKDLDLPQRSIYLESDGKTCEFTEPAIDDREKAFFYSLQKSIGFSPDGKSMVFRGSVGCILEFFSLKGGIQRTCIKRFLPPSVTVANGSYRQNDDYIFGGGKLCTTDRHVYMAYDGKHTYKEWQQSGRTCLLYNNISVFDWKGTPGFLYTTDYRIMALSVVDDTTVYAFLEDADERRFMGKAELVH